MQISLVESDELKGMHCFAFTKMVLVQRLEINDCALSVYKVSKCDLIQNKSIQAEC